MTDIKPDIVIGDGYSLDVTAKVEEEGTGTAVDISSGAVLIMALKEDVDDSVEAVRFTTGAISAFETTGIQATVSLTATQTAALKEGQFHYDILVEHGGNAYRTAVGTIITRYAVTNPTPS